MTARAQQAIREGVAPFAIGGELNFVHGEEIDLALKRHRLDRANEIAGGRGEYLLFACDEGDVAGALHFHHPVIDLAGEEPEREADHAGFVPHHPLDREMGLAGVRGPQNGRNAPAFREAVPGLAGGVLGRRGAHVSRRTFRAKQVRCKAVQALTVAILRNGILRERTGSESATGRFSTFVHG